MRFSAPRSTSPSPVRRSSRHKSATPARTIDKTRSSTYGLVSDSESDAASVNDEEDVGSSSDASTSSSSSSSSNSFCYESESEIPPPKPPIHRAALTTAQLSQSETNAASIRLHTSFTDPYEEWQKQTRREAFHTARLGQSSTQNELRKSIQASHANMAKTRKDHHDKQEEQVCAVLEKMRIKSGENEERLRASWREREVKILERIQRAIDIDEKKVRDKMEEEERIKREEQDKQKKVQAEAEAKKSEEAKKKSEEDAAAAKKAEDMLKATLTKQAEEHEAKQVAEKEQSEKKQTESTSSGPHTDWSTARSIRMKLKTGPIAQVKADTRAKSTWGAIRRQIRARVGQLVNDPVVIDRISTQLYTLLRPAPHAPAHPEALYLALLSALAKAILAQAEIEVVAKPAAAHPLGIVTANLLGSLPEFASIFWARTVQRTGGWAVPYHLSATMRDWDDTPLGNELRKARGYADSEDREEEEEYGTRVAAIMRVYFEAVSTPNTTTPPLESPLFHVSRVWVWLSRCMNSGDAMLGHQAAPQVIHAALAVAGPQARGIWGKQFVKLLQLIYEGVKNGYGDGAKKKTLGGGSPEANAARVRVQLEIEKIMA